jgi:hypothetical protein
MKLKSFLKNRVKALNATIKKLLLCCITFLFFWTLSASTALELQKEARSANKIFKLEKGILVARDIKSHKRLWVFGRKLQAPVAYVSKIVFTYSLKKILYAVNQSSGKTIWSKLVDVYYPTKLFGHKNNLIIDFYPLIISINLSNWKLNWKSDLSGGTFGHTTQVYQNIAIYYFEFSGAYSGIRTYGINLDSGKTIWDRYSDPVIKIPGYYIFSDLSPLLNLDAAYEENFIILNVISGEAKTIFHRVAEMPSFETNPGFLVRNGCGRAIRLYDPQMTWNSAFFLDSQYFWIKRKDDCGLFYTRISWTENPIPEPTIVPINK